MIALPYFKKTIKDYNLPGEYRMRHTPIGEEIEIFDWNSRISSNYPQPLLMSKEMLYYTREFYEIFQQQRDALKDVKRKKKVLEFFNIPTKKEKGTFNISNFCTKNPKKYVQNEHIAYPLTVSRTGVTSVSLKNLQGRFNHTPDLRYCQ